MGFRVVRVGLGLFLLAAAALKLDGMTIDPLSEDSFLGSPRLQFASAELEILLGLWLLVGWRVRAARYVAMGFFWPSSKAQLVPSPCWAAIVRLPWAGRAESVDHFCRRRWGAATA